MIFVHLRSVITRHAGVTMFFIVTGTTLTLWRPSADVMSLLAEGKRFKIFNVSVGENRYSK